MLSAKLIVLVLLGQTPGPAPDPDALIEKLGSASYAEREATKSLESLGSKALPALRSALKAKDPEVRIRAKAMINRIEGNLLIQESLVRLDFKDVSLDEIVKSLKKQTGAEVTLGAPGPEFAGRRITLRETQPVPFWKAIDRICAEAKLSFQYQYMGPRGQSLVLSSQPNLVNQPSYYHGPFRVSIVSLSYQSEILFQQNARMVAQMRPVAPRLGGVAKKTGVLPLAKARAGSPGPGEAEKADNAPARIVQFRAQFQVAPEPRMTFSLTGNLKLLEAVDELGQSLVPSATDDERTFGPMGMMSGPVGMMSNGMMSGQMANLAAPLRRPETPGKQIKTLRGTVDVTVSSPRANPLVIPLENAVGKTFQNDDRHVVVNSIDIDPMTRQDVIELTVDDLDELFRADGSGGVGMAVPNGMIGGGFGRRIGGDPSRGQIQILTSTGQSASYQTSIDSDAGRLTLRVLQVPQMGEIKEIRISSVIRAVAKVPFEFHDLPMP
jgi:hypothetical protein